MSAARLRSSTTKVRLLASAMGVIATALLALPATAGPEVALETSPLAPVFRGAAVAVRLRWAAAPHLAFGGGVYAFTLPSFFVDQIDGNQDEGWRVSIRPAAHASLDYFLGQHGAGVSFGLAAVLARFAISSDVVSGSTAYESLYVVPRVAYTIRVWRRLYLAPSFGLELHTKIAGDTKIADRTFEPPRLQPTFGLQLGYVLAEAR